MTALFKQGYYETNEEVKNLNIRYEQQELRSERFYNDASVIRQRAEKSIKYNKLVIDVWLI